MSNKLHTWYGRIAAVVAALAFSGWIVQPAQGDPNAGLVAHWCFNDCTGTDCSPNTYNGTNSGAACVDSPWTKALEFKTTDIVQSIPASWDDSIVTNQAFTVAAWVKWEGPDATYSLGAQCIILDGRGGSAGAGGMSFYVYGEESNGKLRFHFNEPASYLSNNPIPPNVWTHVAVVFDGATDKLRFYIMGQLDSEHTRTETYGNSSLTAAIGQNRWAPTDSQWAVFNGLIDELRVYNRALTGEELKIGACCLPANVCLSPIWEAECHALTGGHFMGRGTTTCPHNPDGSCKLGACCTPGECGNNTDDDADAAVNDGCPAVGPAETIAQCGNTTDDDADGRINDGCAQVGPAAEDCTLDVTEEECIKLEGRYRGDGSTSCPPDCMNIPTVSEWGLVVMAILVLSAATVVIMRRRAIVHGGT